MGKNGGDNRFKSVSNLVLYQLQMGSCSNSFLFRHENATNSLYLSSENNVSIKLRQSNVRVSECNILCKYQG